MYKNLFSSVINAMNPKKDQARSNPIHINKKMTIMETTFKNRNSQIVMAAIITDKMATETITEKTIMTINSTTETRVSAT